MLKIIKENEIINNINDDTIIITRACDETYYKEKLFSKNVKIYTLNNFILNSYNGSYKLANSNLEYLTMYEAYNKVKTELTKYNNIDDLFFIDDLLSTYKEFNIYKLNNNIKINDLNKIFDLYETLLLSKNLINYNLIFKRVLEKEIFDKNYIFLNLFNISDEEIELIKKMSINSNVLISINSYNENLISKLKSIDNSLLIDKLNNNNILNYYALNDISDEVSFVLNDISKKIMKENAKYNDFLIIVKDEKLYEPYFKLIFDIPYSKKEYNSILTSRFLKIFSSIINGDFSCINFLNLLKLDLFGIDLNLIDKLDNYIYINNLEKENFYFPFNKGNLSDIEELNNLKNSIIVPFKCFLENIINENNLNVIAKEFWTYLSLIKVDEQLFLKDPIGYNNFVSLSDDICDNFNFDMNACMYFSIISYLVKESYSIREYKDEVMISDINNASLNNKKYVYLMGVSSDLYPSCFSLNSLIKTSDLVRDDLIDKINYFTACDKADFDLITSFNNIIITYHKLGPDLSLKSPSLYLNGNLIDNYSNLYNKKLIINNYSDLLSSKKIYKLDSDDCLINKINNANIHNLNFKIGKDSAIKLYTNNLMCSPTSIETYSKCKFYHFCQYGLKLDEKEKKIFDNRQIGSIVHYILENIIKNDFDNINIDNIEEKSKTYAYTYLKNNNIILDSITKYIVDKLILSTCFIIKNIIKEKNITSFEPKYFEFKIDDISIVKPVIISLNNGSMTLNGTIDRVDVYTDKDNYYYRIIDYKTGGKKLRLDDCILGLNLQMLLYLLAIKESSSNLTDKKQVPTAVLYYPAILKEEEIKRNLSDDEKKNSVSKRLLMEGLVNKDDNCISILGSDKIGDFINVTSRGKISEEKVFNLDDLYLLFENIKKTLKDIGDNILDGNIEVSPVKGRVDACSFCKFSSICGFDNEIDKPRYLKNYKNSEVFKMLEGDNNA